MPNQTCSQFEPRKKGRGETMSGQLIDVLIPTFNAAKTIRSAVNSVQQQTISDIRILIVDDGSTDRTPHILANLAQSDPRIEILSKTNSGIVDALNFGLSHCRSKILARHDSDDLADPKRFARQLEYLKSYPDCVGVGGAIRHIDENGRPSGRIIRLPSPEWADPTWVPSREPYIMHPFLMTYTASVERVGGYRHVLNAEDTDLFWRLREIGRLHNLEDFVGYYRMHKESVSGASLINGRIAALNSQLAAISVLRRKHQRPDLPFRKQDLREYKDAASLENMLEVCAHRLDRSEVEYLRVSTAAKLLELAAYRPFELELADCQFIWTALHEYMRALDPGNRAMIRRMRTGTAARLLSSVRPREAMTLVYPRLYPEVVSRMAFRAFTPSRSRRLLRHLLGRPEFTK
jgi:glycosyltransferase involved in cell wall biosynthesis